MASSPQDFDLFMPSAERIMDSVQTTPVKTPSALPTRDAQGKKDDGPLKPLHQDPHWPLLNRWSTSPIPPAKVITEAHNLGEASSSTSSPQAGETSSAMKPLPLILGPEGDYTTAPPFPPKGSKCILQSQ